MSETIVEWFDNERIKSAIPLNDHSVRNGVARWYYPKGNIQTEVPYLQGKKQGVAKGYHSNGHLKYTYYFLDDNQVTKKMYDEAEICQTTQ